MLRRTVIYDDFRWAAGYNLFFTSFPISYLALWDKDVTYEWVMSEEEEETYYQAHTFTGESLDQSYLPTSTIKIFSEIKKHYHKLYYLTQDGSAFGWSTFFGEVINGLVIAMLIGYIGYNVFGGDIIMHSDGYNPDYWMASFALYSSLIYCTNVVLLIRANQITWLLTLAYVGAASLMPFFVLVFLFDTVLEVQNAGSRSYLNLCQTWHYYFFCLSVIMACSFIEISKKMYRMFWKPYLNDYFKYLIHRGEQDNPENFKPEILEAFVKIHDPI